VQGFSIFPLPVVTATADTTICLGQTLPLAAGGALSYAWQPPSNSSLTCTNCFNPTASPTNTTSYIVTGTSALGCVASDTIQVTVNLPVTVTVQPPSDSVCAGQTIQLTASGAALYTWSPSTGLSNPDIANPRANPTVTTLYQVTGSDNKSCFNDTKSVNVTVFDYPTLNLGPDATIPVGSSYQINGNGSSDIVSINWLPVTGLSCTNCLSPLASPINTTTYIASASNSGGCLVSDSIKITVICTNNNFFVPNTFSPNGDGVNDVFYVRGKGLNIIPSIIIFNRWGQIVFEKKDFAPNDPTAGWDGNFNGGKAPVDVYVYTLQLICDNSTVISYNGNVALIR
jgi:gliding motility-associated-like protein